MQTIIFRLFFGGGEDGAARGGTGASALSLPAGTALGLEIVLTLIVFPIRFINNGASGSDS